MSGIGSFLDDFIMMAEGKAASEDELWREQPVDLVTFFKSKDFLNEKPYPGKQTELLEVVNQVIWYKLTGDEKLCREDLRKITELIFMFGKGCKHGRTSITDAHTGTTYTFEELYESGKKITVTALDEDTQKFVKAQASEVVRVGKGEILEIETYSGHTTLVYPEHIFLSRKYTGSIKGKYRGAEWKKVRELKEGDQIALARRTLCEGGTKVDKRELRLVGYLLGDGNISDKWKCNFIVANYEVESDYCDILRSYGVEPKYTEYSNEARTDRVCKCITASLTTWESRSNGGNPITSITRKYGIQGENAYSKHIPKEFFDLDIEHTIEFLRALFATDGWVCMLKGRIPQVGYCSVSKELVEGIAIMLRKLGIMCRIDKKVTGSNFGHAYQLTVNSEVDFRRFCNLIHIVGKYAKQLDVLNRLDDYKSTVTGKKKSRLDTDIYFDRIKSIKSIGEDYYYDLTVENYANYVSDGFIDHNSGKDFLISGILAYLSYLLCCMRDPHQYFGFGQDEPIDLINVAINAYQANNVFFKKFKARLGTCGWFKRVGYNPAEADYVTPNSYQITKNQIRFYKNITAHSAHSDADSFEGFNPLVVILDEIGGFEPEKAEDCYSTLRSSAISRYGNKALLMFISFPRSMDDFMMVKYKEATENNDPQVFAMIGKSWEVNPRITRESLDKDYATDPEGAKMKYESLTADTYIWTTRGSIRICDVVEGDTIMTAHGDRQVLKAIKSGKKQTYKVITNEGYEIKGSANHPMKVIQKSYKGDRYEWKTIKELKKSDLIYLEMSNYVFGQSTLSTNFMYLLGGLVADGIIVNSVRGKVIKWVIPSDDYLVNKYYSAIVREFKYVPSIKRTADSAIISIENNDIANKFIDIGFNHCGECNKAIPPVVFQQGESNILEFLKAFIDSNGYVSSKNGNVAMFSCKEELANQLQRMLLMLGIKSNKQKTTANCCNFGKGGGSWLIYLTEVGSALLNSKVEYVLPSNRNNQYKCELKKQSSKYAFAVVKSIIPNGEEECYDLWTEPENEFIANGMAVHNCIPPAYRDGFFQFPERIDECTNYGKHSQCQGLIVQEKITTRTVSSGEERHFLGLEVFNLHLNPAYTYYIGGDAGVSSDSYIITLYHAEPTLIQVVEDGELVNKMFNKPVEDLILEWRPSKKDKLPVDLMNVADILERICTQVYVKKALFDKFNSAEVVQRLMSYGVDAEDKNWSNPFQLQLYQNAKTLIYTGQVEFLDYKSPYENIVHPNEELKQIKIINGNKIDHDKDKTKDFSDARVAAIYLCSMDEIDAQTNFAMPVLMGAQRK